MFIRLKTTDGEININANQIVSFTPQDEGSLITLSTGALWTVQESNRSVRHAIKKATAPAGAEAE